MKNSIFIGNFRETSGWGVASYNYLKAASLAGIPYTCGRITYNYYQSEPDEDISKHENTIYEEYHNIVQIALPHMYDRIEGYKNIGVCFLETPEHLTLDLSDWYKRIISMDEIWVSTNQEKEKLQQYGINAYFVPQPLNLKYYKDPRQKINGLPEGFNFYYIGGMEERKNLRLLIKAYFTEFAADEKVNLIIKTNPYVAKKLKLLIDDIKPTIRIKNEYPKIFLVTEHYTESQMLDFHYSCDCLVMPSSSECPSRPVMDAIGIGKPTLVTANTGMAELPVFDTIDSYEDYCSCKFPPLKFLYTGKETWQIPVVKSIAEKMRKIYELFSEGVPIKINQNLSKYSWENVGELMKCRLLI